MTHRNKKELTEARQLVKRLHQCQKLRKLTNRGFTTLCKQYGVELGDRTYPNWLTANGNLPRRSAFPGIRQVLAALEVAPAEPAQVSAQAVPVVASPPTPVLTT